MTAEIDAGAAQRRAELGRFLRARRERLAPDRFGLPVGPRRRAPGLLREEVAALAGLSTTWYTYLEQGRDIRPSRQVVETLGTVLELDADETSYLLRLAFGGEPPAAPDGSATGVRIRPDDVVRHLGGTDSPFYAGRQNGDVVAWNEAFTTWFADFGALPDDRRNMLRWMVTDPVARERFPLWHAELRDVAGRLRARLPEHSTDEATRCLVDELIEISPEFSEVWDEYHVVDQRVRYRQMRHPELGFRLFRLLALRAADDTDLVYVVHLPADDLCDP